MTSRTKLYLRNKKGSRSHVIIFKFKDYTKQVQIDQLHQAIGNLNKLPRLPHLVAIAVPETVDVQVIKL